MDVVAGLGSRSREVDFDREPGKVGQVASKPERDSVRAEKRRFGTESGI